MSIDIRLRYPRQLTFDVYTTALVWAARRRGRRAAGPSARSAYRRTTVSASEHRTLAIPTVDRCWLEAEVLSDTSRHHAPSEYQCLIMPEYRKRLSLRVLKLEKICAFQLFLNRLKISNTNLCIYVETVKVTLLSVRVCLKDRAWVRIYMFGKNHIQ